VRGGTLEQWLERGDPGAQQALPRLADALRAMHGCRGRHIGRVALAGSGVAPRLRFGEHYRSLREDGLDEERLRFYRLAMHLSLIAGPLRLLDGDFPDREPMRRIVEYNIDKALEFVR